MIPSILLVALLVACGKTDSPQTHSITVEQRDAAIESANELLQTNQVQEALAITSTLVANASDSAKSQEVHARALIAEGLRLDGLGKLGKAQEKRHEALDAYILACTQSTTPGLLQLSTAQMAQMIGEDEIAHEYYKLAHVNVPDDGRASFFLAQMEMLDKQWEEGRDWISQSLERNPNEPYALLSLAVIEAELGNFSIAITLAAKGCSISPTDPNLRFMQARVLRLSGKPQQAMEILLALPVELQFTQVCQDEMNTIQKEIEKLGDKGNSTE
jgi:tetratricopeptide (TPR) repeat protein